MCSLASIMSILLHCREDTHSDSSLREQYESTDYFTKKVEIPLLQALLTHIIQHCLLESDLYVMMKR